MTGHAPRPHTAARARRPGAARATFQTGAHVGCPERAVEHRVEKSRRVWTWSAQPFTFQLLRGGRDLVAAGVRQRHQERVGAVLDELGIVGFRPGFGQRVLCDRQGFRQSHALGVLLGIVLARPVQCLAEVLDAPGGRRGRLDGGGRRFGRRMQFSNGRRRLLHLAARRGWSAARSLPVSTKSSRAASAAVRWSASRAWVAAPCPRQPPPEPHCAARRPSGSPASALAGRPRDHFLRLVHRLAFLIGLDRSENCQCPVGHTPLLGT